MPAGSIYTYVGNADPSDNVGSIQTSQGDVYLGQWGYFLPSEVQTAAALGLILEAGIVPPASEAPVKYGAAMLGSDGTVSGPGGSPLTASVVTVSSGTPTAGQVPVANEDDGYTWGHDVPYGLAIGKGACAVPVGLRNHEQFDVVVTNSWSLMGDRFEPIGDPDCTMVLPLFNNPFWVGGSAPGDCDPPNAITVAFSIVASDGTILPATFGGKRSVVIPREGGQFVAADSPISFGNPYTVGNYQGFGVGIMVRTWVGAGTWREDVAAVVSGSDTVYDLNILSTDNGKPVVGPGIPNGTYVGTVTAGVSFLLSSSATSQVNVNASANGDFVRVGGPDTVARTDTVTVTAASATVADASILATDLGRLVTGTGVPAGSQIGLPLIPGTSFTLVTPSGPGNTMTNVNATANGTSVTISSQIPQNCGTIWAASDVAVQNGSDYTYENAPAIVGASNAATYGPMMLLGPAQSGRKPIVLGATDSIFNGTTDSFVGPIVRAVAASGFFHVKLSKFGEYATTFQNPTGRRYRQALIPGCTHAIIELGTNDGVTNAGSVTSINARLTAAIAYFTSIGIKVWVCTVPPKSSSSSDNYATQANQTPYNIPADLAALNAAIRAGLTGASGYIDLNTIVSTAQDSGYWAVSPRGRNISDAQTLSGSPSVASLTANFASGDVGLCVWVATAGLTAATKIVNNVATPSGGPAWAAASAQALGAFVAPGNGLLYWASTAGTTGSSQPTWPTTTGNTVTDGSVTWTCLGAATGVVMSANATSSVTAATANIGAYWGTADGVHPSAAQMTNVVLPAVQTVVNTFRV